MTTAPGRIVLIVEDEWLVRMDMAMTFRNDGWQVLEASSGEEALKILSAPLDVNLLLTDIRLDGALTGWDLAEAFRNRHPDIPVIYASANPPETDRQVARSEFVHKPVFMFDILAASERLLPRC